MSPYRASKTVSFFFSLVRGVGGGWGGVVFTIMAYTGRLFPKGVKGYLIQANAWIKVL